MGVGSILLFIAAVLGGSPGVAHGQQPESEPVRVHEAPWLTEPRSSSAPHQSAPTPTEGHFTAPPSAVTLPPTQVFAPTNIPGTQVKREVFGEPAQTGDVNGDGVDDVLVDEQFLFNGRNGALQTTYDQDLQERLYPVGNVMGDARTDAIRSNGEVFVGTASGFVDAETSALNASYSFPRGFRDLDGDGYDDVVAPAYESNRSGQQFGFAVGFGSDDAGDAGASVR